MAVRAITAIRAFHLKGSVVNIGDTVSVQGGLASELISAYKAVPAIEVKQVKPPVVVDEPVVEVPADTPAETSTDTTDTTENKSRGRYRNVK